MSTAVLTDFKLLSTSLEASTQCDALGIHYKRISGLGCLESGDAGTRGGVSLRGCEAAGASELKMSRRVREFYGCYLLSSLADRGKNKTYIGYVGFV
jgi:hypothetical protein